MTRIRAVCLFCKKEWDDEYDLPEGHIHGYSICYDCCEEGNKEKLDKMFSEYWRGRIRHE